MKRRLKAWVPFMEHILEEKPEAFLGFVYRLDSAEIADQILASVGFSLVGIE